MTESQAVALTVAASFAVLYGVMFTLPASAGARAFFGYRVNDTTIAADGAHILRGYRAVLTIAFLSCAFLGILASMAAGHRAPVIVSPLVAAAISFAAYIRSAARVEPFALPGTNTRFASALGVRSVRGYSHWAIEGAVVLLTVAAFALLAFYYPQLPDRRLLFAPALAAYLQVVMFVIKRDLVGAKMTLPGDGAERFLAAKDSYLRANTQLLDWARLAIAILILLVVMLPLSLALPVPRAFGAALRVALVATGSVMAAGVAWFIWRMKSVNDALRREAGDFHVQRSAEEAHWRHGGLTYYNPNDPALVVEKLVGYGYTWNMAHPAVWRRGLLLVGLPLFIMLALASF